MEVRFYKFTKKENSTMIPTNPFVVFDCIIKNESAIVNPTIEIVSAMNENPHEWNYCFIPDFNRYYWVAEWSWSNRKWIASLNVDVLSTYKTEIGNFNGYILRSSYQYDGNIVDDFYPYKAQRQISKQVASFYQWSRNFLDTGDSPAIGNGTFCIQVAGETYNDLIALQYSNLETLVGQMNTAVQDNAGTQPGKFNLDDASFALQQALVNPFQYIKSCMWFPISFGEIGDFTLTGLTIGGIPFPNISYRIFPGIFNYPDFIEFEIPKHPNVSTRGNYLNVVGTKYHFYYPPFGYIELDSEKASRYRYVQAYVSLDCTTGIAKCEIGYSNTSGDFTTKFEIMDTYIETQLGVEVQLSQIYKDRFAGYSNALGTVGSAISNLAVGNIPGAIVGAGTGIMSGIDSMRPHVQTIGSPGGYVSMKGRATLYSEFMIPVDDDNAHHGRPLCVNGQLSNYPGYLMILNGDVDAVATREELNQIKSYLEGGFYYE